MKRLVIPACILTALLSGCISGILPLGKTVGKQIRDSDITEFYFTRSGSTNPPTFQRYKLYAEEGAHYFYHEKREGNHWPLIESDITETGKKQLTEEEWMAFYELLEGGTVKRRSESADAGGSGPWLYLYWKGDRYEEQEYTFVSYEKERAFEEACKEMKKQMK